MKDHAVVHWKRFLNSSKLLKPSFTRRLLNLVPLIPLPSTVCSVCLYTCQSSSSLIVFRFTSKVPSLARAVFYIYCSNCPFLTGVVLNFSSVAVFLSIGHAHPIVIQGFSGLRMYMILYIQLIVFLFFCVPFQPCRSHHSGQISSQAENRYFRFMVPNPTEKTQIPPR